ncbi:MAG TPA: hypothetical protein VIG86_02190 [Candidatus Dormibacteraeota bacterium]
MISRCFSNRMLAVCAVAVLGSAALIPVRTLAGDQGHDNAGSAQHGGSDRGRSDHAHGDAEHRDATTTPSSRHASADRSTACGDASRGGGDDRCNGQPSRPATSSAAAGDTVMPGVAATPARGKAGAGSGAVESGTGAGSASASSINRPAGATRALSAAGGVVPIRGVSLPGTPVPISNPPVSNPTAGRPPAAPSPAAAAPPRNPILGPVPVLGQSIGATVTHPGAAPPWGWLIAFVIADALLVAFIVIRRRRASSGPL